MSDSLEIQERFINKILAYFCVCYVALALIIDHNGKFSLSANHYRFVFWFAVPFVFFLLTVYSAKDRRDILHWLDVRSVSRKEWYVASALMLCLVLVIAVIPIIPSLADYYKPRRINFSYRFLWLLAWFPGWELMHRCLLAYHIPRSLPKYFWLLIPLFEGLYHFNKPLPEMLGMFAWSGALTFYTIRRKNACLAILAHLVLECLLIAYLGLAA
jgi:succinate dehydrogenase hydrophobic anchor subunit